MKNYCLYALKIIAAYAVVFIHCPFPFRLGSAMDALARFAVPLFFMISGFFAFERSNKQILKNVKKTLKLLCLAYIIYLCWLIIKSHFHIDTVRATFASWFNISSFIKTFVFNCPPAGVSAHLWYLGAILYCYLFLMLVNKFCLTKFIYALVPILLMLHLYLGEFSSVFNMHTPVRWVRNFALMGIPFFFLGHWLRKNKDIIQGTLFSPIYTYMIIIAGSIMTLFERYFFHKQELYLGSIVLSTILMIHAIQYPNRFKNTYIAELGMQYSSNIYLYHPIVIFTLWKCLDYFGLSSILFLRYLVPLCVCVVTTICVIFFHKFYTFMSNVTKCKS